MASALSSSLSCNDVSDSSEGEGNDGKMTKKKRTLQENPRSTKRRKVMSREEIPSELDEE
jgi:hypothetical protein